MLQTKIFWRLKLTNPHPAPEGTNKTPCPGPPCAPPQKPHLICTKRAENTQVAATNQAYFQFLAFLVFPLNRHLAHFLSDSLAASCLLTISVPKLFNYNL